MKDEQKDEESAIKRQCVLTKQGSTRPGKKEHGTIGIWVSGGNARRGTKDEGNGHTTQTGKERTKKRGERRQEGQSPSTLLTQKKERR